MTSNTLKEITEYVNQKIGNTGFHLLVLVDASNPKSVLKSTSLPDDVQIFILEYLLEKLKEQPKP